MNPQHVTKCARSYKKFYVHIIKRCSDSSHTVYFGLGFLWAPSNAGRQN